MKSRSMRAVSARAAALEESQTIAFTTRARELRASGLDVISMTAGEPDYPTPSHIRAAAIEAIEAGFTRYTAVPGIPELIDAVAEKFAADNDLHFSPRQIVVTTGAKQALVTSLLAVCNEGDEVLVPGPFWVSYPPMIKLAGAVPVIVRSRLADGFRPRVDGLRAAVTSRTRAIIVNSPSNPTGMAYTREELAAIARLAQERNLYLISDEIYEKMLFDGRRHVSIGTLPGAEGRTITVNGLSKSYAMTGWRVGFMGGPEEVIEAAVKIQSQLTSNTNSIAQKAAVAALRGPQEGVAAMTREFQRRRDIAVEGLRAVPEFEVAAPEGAMFCFFGVEALYDRTSAGRALSNSVDFVEHMLDRQHVVLVPGAAFGDDSCIRLSFACPVTELREGLRRIALAVGQIRR